MKDMLKEDSEVSTMRWSLMHVIYMSYIIVICIGSHVIIATLKTDPVEWSGIGLALAGLAAFIGAAVAGKYHQKKQEAKNDKSD